MNEKVKPIDMVLFCPKCGFQHIDKAEEFTPIKESCACRGPDVCEVCTANEECYREWVAQQPWLNPPHKSHLCLNSSCGHIWRPADVETNGVEAVKTIGKKDSVLIIPEFVVWQLKSSVNC